ncbi:Hypp6229 [Branchiostoma lanceolatum]|uniref:Hypp6229 protein n=1 Tax=Branchiostoma lanceolatum TaxID=7740 RepID=A0A8J9W611_BRALA|nr:Hypp6229 [Branchiostoma lanceolatum]
MLQKLQQHLTDKEGDKFTKDAKSAIREDLSGRYREDDRREFREEATALDPRFKSSTATEPNELVPLQKPHEDSQDSNESPANQPKPDFTLPYKQLEVTRVDPSEVRGEGMDYAVYPTRKAVHFLCLAFNPDQWADSMEELPCYGEEYIDFLLEYFQTVLNKVESRNNDQRTREQTGSLTVNFVAAVVQNLRNRFPETELITAFKIIDTNNLPPRQDALRRYGTKELETLLAKYRGVEADQFLTVDAAQARQEWDLLRQLRLRVGAKHRLLFVSPNAMANAKAGRSTTARVRIFTREELLTRTAGGDGRRPQLDMSKIEAITDEA